MSAHDFNLAGEDGVLCSTFWWYEGLHVQRSVDLRSVDGIRSPSRIQRLRRAVPRGLSLAWLQLPRPVFVHGVCPTDVSRELARHRNLPAFGPAEAVPRWFSRARFAQHAGRRQLPKRLQAGAKEKLHQIWMADMRAHAHEAFDLFIETYQAKYPKAVECVNKDREELLAFYDFPAEHWVHLRTTNPIESVFATVKHRQKKTRGNGRRAACLAMVFKLAQSASQKWRTLNGSSLLPDVIQGIQFIDGIKHTEAAA